jgi:hypothetical protein
LFVPLSSSEDLAIRILLLLFTWSLRIPFLIFSLLWTMLRSAFCIWSLLEDSALYISVSVCCSGYEMSSWGGTLLWLVETESHEFRRARLLVDERVGSIMYSMYFA